jgi:putative DNA-invertase from lambdoid prophage Rac
VTSTLHAYVRVSTDAQDTDLQLRALEGFGVPMANVYTDRAISGKVPSAERPGVVKLLARASRGDTVVVYSLSRLGRSTLDVLTVLQTLDAQGVHFRSLTEAFDTTTPMGRAMLGIMAVLAQLEREMLVERTNAGIAAAKARGVRFGREETPGRRAEVEACCHDGMTKAEAARHLELPYNAIKRMWPGSEAKKSA